MSRKAKPTFVKTVRVDTRGNCGRTDVRPNEPMYKIIEDNTKCDEQMCYTEKSVSSTCPGCGAVTMPESESILDMSYGPRVRRLVFNICQETS